MAFVETKLGGRSYRIDCAEAQLERLKRLTSVVEARAGSLENSGAAAIAPEGEDPELRFLLLTGLLVADLLIKAEDALEEARSERQTIEQAPREFAQGSVEEAEIVCASCEAAATKANDAANIAEDEAPAIDPEIEAALADLLESAAERMHEAAETLERL